MSGYKRAGKDFISDILLSKIKGSVRYSLAEPLKDIMATTLGTSKEELDELKNRQAPCLTLDDDRTISKLTDFRKVLQVFGSEAMKKWFGDSVWVDVFIHKNIINDVIIISDWRFNIEYNEIVKTYDNVITLRVVDDNIVNTDMHASETELDDFNFDFTVDNTAKDSSIISALDKFIKEIT